MARSTASRAAGATRRLSLITRDTVDRDTPASWATSSSVGMLRTRSVLQPAPHRPWQGACRVGGAPSTTMAVMSSTSSGITRVQLASLLDHTLLKPEATSSQVAALCEEAERLGVGAVCVSPCMLPFSPDVLAEDITICTVIGFPSGAVDSRVKAAEAALAFANGAQELDMVVNLGRIKEGDWEGVEADIAEVCAAVPFGLVKVILETAALTEKEIVEACKVAESAGADFVKTSTGFHPTGGASLEAVRLIHDTVGGRLGIKASGGIRDTATALAMIDAGATRIGTSSSAAILGGL